MPEQADSRRSIHGYDQQFPAPAAPARQASVAERLDIGENVVVVVDANLVI